MIEKALREWRFSKGKHKCSRQVYHISGVFASGKGAQKHG